MTAVSVQKISLSYGKKKVLRNLSFQIEKQDFFILIGPNGAGKSSLLRTLTGIDKTDSGSISFFDQSLHDYSRRQFSRLTALVPQNLEAGLPFRVADAVLMGRAPHLGLLQGELEKDYDIARQAMEETDTIHLAEQTLDQLSGGERQRVIIARAICQQPRVLFLDEPTASLDLAHQVRIMDLLATLRREKKITVCMVSHDINLAAMYGDRLLLLKEGEVVANGKPEQILTGRVLEEAYGCRLLVDKNPVSGTCRVSPLPARVIG